MMSRHTRTHIQTQTQADIDTQSACKHTRTSACTHMHTAINKTHEKCMQKNAHAHTHVYTHAQKILDFNTFSNLSHTNKTHQCPCLISNKTYKITRTGHSTQRARLVLVIYNKYLIWGLQNDKSSWMKAKQYIQVSMIAWDAHTYSFSIFTPEMMMCGEGLGSRTSTEESCFPNLSHRSPHEIARFLK